jgi:hypothetical protein
MLITPMAANSNLNATTVGRVVRPLLPSSSVMLIDSETRDFRSDPMPTDFNVNLSQSGQGVSRILHRSMQWTQTLFTHNLSDWEIVVSISDAYSDKMVTFALPCMTYTSFTGNDEEPWYVPESGSYCNMLEQALRWGLRRVSDPTTVVVDEDGQFIYHLGYYADFIVRYSKDTGLVIALDQTRQQFPLYFRFEPCTWMSRGRNVHGFGVKNFSRPNIENLQAVGPLTRGTEGVDPINFIMEPTLYQLGVNMYTSSSFPQLVYTKYVIPTSKEICTDRLVNSFTNQNQAGAISGQEINIFPISRNRLATLQTLTTTTDPTVIARKKGDALQHFNIRIIDQYGYLIKTPPESGNIFAVSATELAAKNIPIPWSSQFYSQPFGKDPYPPIKGNGYSVEAITWLFQNHSDQSYAVQTYINARMDMSEPITHFFEMVMV